MNEHLIRDITSLIQQALMDSYNEGLANGRAEERSKKAETLKDHDAKIVEEARARWKAEKRREHQHLVDMVMELAENLGVETATWYNQY